MVEIFQRNLRVKQAYYKWLASAVSLSRAHSVAVGTASIFVVIRIRTYLYASIININVTFYNRGYNSGQQRTLRKGIVVQVICAMCRYIAFTSFHTKLANDTILPDLCYVFLESRGAMCVR